VTDTPARNPHTTLVALFSVAHTPEQAEHAAKTVLELHAHYLAEQIRQTPCDPGVDVCACCAKAADAIDPEVKP
jgi:hypothetical protein